VRQLKVIAVALCLASPVAAHHSDAGVDMQALVTVEGRVTEFNWRNPHVYFTVETNGAAEPSVEWEFQLGSTITVTRMGWTADSLRAGDLVTVRAHPAENGRPYGILEAVWKEDGALPASFASGSSEPQLERPDAIESATTLEGIWMADTSKLVSYPGGFDGFFDAELELTEKGAAAKAAYDPFSEENPETTCVGRPTPAMIMSSGIYPLQIELDEAREIVFIRSEFWDEERVVYMDGRGHPDAGERQPSGHSIGRRDGNVLVVDTTNFSDHRSPYQIGVPSGAQKHVVERYRLTEAGTRIVVEFTLEDPEYIAVPLTHSRELIHSPHMQFSRFNCDPEATRRFAIQ